MKSKTLTSDQSKNTTLGQENTDIEKIKKILIKHGRENADVLSSNQIRFAVTPWMHLYCTDTRLKQVSEEEIDILLKALSMKMKKQLKRMGNG